MKIIIVIITFSLSIVFAQGITNTLGGNTSSDKFIVESLNGGDIIIATGDGKLGIGVSNPSFKLDVNGVARVTGFRMQTGATYGYVLTSDGVGTGTWQQIPTANADNDWTLSNSNLIMAPIGFVGIGTSSPHSKLHVISTTTGGADNTAKFEATGIGNNASHVHYGTKGDWYIRSAADDGKIIIQDSGGNVGIGTNSPNAKLDIAGTVKVGINGTLISEIKQVTGTTASSGNHAHFNYPSGYNLGNTRVLSVEISSDYGWDGLGQKHIGSMVGITYNMSSTGVGMTYDSSYQNRNFRVLLLKVN